MGDPFSAAGTAVGITSLGLPRRHRQLHSALKACEDALNTLKRTVHKCAVTNQAQGVQARLREVRKRLLWPYKKETVADLQANLSTFQSNLNLAVQYAGLDGILRKLDDFTPSINTIQGQTADIKQNLTNQAHTLSALHKDMNDAGFVRRRHHENLSRELSKIQTQSSHQHATIEYKLDILISSITSYPYAATVPPSVLADSIQLLNDVRRQDSGSMINWQPRRSHSTSGVSRPSCGCRPKTRHSVQYGRWMSFLSEDTFQHRLHCPYFAHTQHTRSVAAQFTVCNRLVGFCIRAGWQRSKVGAWNSIAPFMRYRAVVPSDTGAFKILMEANKVMGSLQEGGSYEQALNLMRTTSRALQQSFHTDSSPYDVDVRGQSLLARALPLIQHAIGRGVTDCDLIYNLLDLCLAPSASGYAPDMCGETPIILWQRMLSDTSQPVSESLAYAAVLEYLARKSGIWSVARPTTSHLISRLQRSELIYDYIESLLRLEDVASDLVDDEPLLLAILRRSTNELETCIGRSDDKDLRELLKRYTYTVPLLSWPTGLRIVVSTGFMNEADALRQTFWRRALRMRLIGAIQVLLRFNDKLSLSTWYEVNFSWRFTVLRLEHLSREILQSEDRARWIELFDALSAKLHSDTSKTCALQNKEELQNVPSPYHTECLTLEAAQSAWEAGFRDVNSAHICHGGRGEIGTPLWALSSRMRLQNDWTVFSWLRSCGANPFWIHPTFLGTPAHQLVQLSRIGSIWKGSAAQLHRVEDLISSPERDGCKCHCSLKGCLCIGCAVTSHDICKAHDRQHDFKRDVPRLRSALIQAVQPYIFSLVYQHKDTAWMSSAVLRMLTFERLALTHTCCYQVELERMGRVQHPTAEEADVIHEQERDDFELLDNLVAEFEAKWAKYDKPFVTFMNRVWKRRMKQVEVENRADQETYQSELVRIGIRLEKRDEEEMDDWPDDYESEDEQRRLVHD